MQQQEMADSRPDFRDVSLVLIPILLIIIAELTIFFGKTSIAIYILIFILLGLSLSAFKITDSNLARVLQALLLLPLLRIVSISMPIFFEITLYSFVFTYVPLIMPIYLIIKHQGFASGQILPTRKLLAYFPLAILLALIIAEVEYWTISSGYLVPDLSLVSMLKISFIMIFIVGVIEETIFRLILQTRLEEYFGMTSGLIITSILFGIMHSGYGTPYEILVAASSGFALGYIYQRTRNLSLISIIHGCINIFLFSLIPHLGPGLGLF